MKATYKSYPSNLTAEQWIFIARYIPVAQRIRADRRLRRLEAEGFAQAEDLEALTYRG